MLSFIKKLFVPATDIKEVLKEGAVIVDVRSAKEFKEGHINGSKNIPLDIITQRIKEIKDFKKPIVTVCRSGARSGMAKTILQNNGIQVYNGGSWTSLDNKLNN
jgi:phage shock protein E